MQMQAASKGDAGAMRDLREVAEDEAQGQTCLRALGQGNGTLPISLPLPPLRKALPAAQPPWATPVPSTQGWCSAAVI